MPPEYYELLNSHLGQRWTDERLDPIPQDWWYLGPVPEPGYSRSSRPNCGLAGWVGARFSGGCELTWRNTGAEVAGVVVGGVVGGGCAATFGVKTLGLGMAGCAAAGTTVGGAVHDFVDGDSSTNWNDPQRRGIDATVGAGTVGAGRVISSALRRSAFSNLTHSSHGIRPYSVQQAVTRGQGGDIQAHHLIEGRFARVMGGNTDDWASIVVTRAEHQQFTNAWRQAIPYGPAGTGTATRSQVEAAARQIYADYPEILRALGL